MTTFDLDPVFSRADAIKSEYLASGCQSCDVDEAVQKLMAECGDLFESAEHAWSFLMEETHEGLEEDEDAHIVALTDSRQALLFEYSALEKQVVNVLTGHPQGTTLKMPNAVLFLAGEGQGAALYSAPIQDEEVVLDNAMPVAIDMEGPGLHDEVIQMGINDLKTALAHHELGWIGLEDFDANF